VEGGGSSQRAREESSIHTRYCCMPRCSLPRWRVDTFLAAWLLYLAFFSLPRFSLGTHGLHDPWVVVVVEVGTAVRWGFQCLINPCR
jgi:hypothetical protein